MHQEHGGHVRGHQLHHHALSRGGGAGVDRHSRTGRRPAGDVGIPGGAAAQDPPPHRAHLWCRLQGGHCQPLRSRPEAPRLGQHHDGTRRSHQGSCVQRGSLWAVQRDLAPGQRPARRDLQAARRHPSCHRVLPSVCVPSFLPSFLPFCPMLCHFVNCL